MEDVKSIECSQIRPVNIPISTDEYTRFSCMFKYYLSTCTGCGMTTHSKSAAKSISHCLKITWSTANNKEDQPKQRCTKLNSAHDMALETPGTEVIPKTAMSPSVNTPVTQLKDKYDINETQSQTQMNFQT